ncbi:MAG: pyridoxamine 5'-phosphate oxidase [Acidimicrobiia bacterium]|nr:MAG: pyridoxamine 5'-phosphate oxidase [Acidimicrobiia bacterium]
MDDGLELLTEAECRSLLASGSIGRVGVTVGALPVILPVNYAFVDGTIVFRTAEGTKLRAAVDRAVIAFEVDDYDEVLQRGWSVLAVGHASEVAGEDDLATFRALGLAPWADGTRTHYVRLVPEVLTGRRIVAV